MVVEGNSKLRSQPLSFLALFERSEDRGSGLQVRSGDHQRAAWIISMATSFERTPLLVIVDGITVVSALTSISIWADSVLGGILVHVISLETDGRMELAAEVRFMV